MQKYYLLIFNEDWADEHNVPAQACFTQHQYDKWCASPTGVKNPKYEAQKADHDQKLAEYQEYINKIREKGLHLKKGNETTEEDRAWLRANEKEYVTSYNAPKKMFSGFNAFLGNNGEGFGDSFDSYEFCQELVDAKIVRVHEVNKEFFEVFNEVRLYDLSLCNVFNEDSLLESAEYASKYATTRSEY